MCTPLTWLFVFLISIQNIFAQNQPESEENQLTGFQKLYVQTDREIYFLGDTIWLSCYLLDGKTHSPAKDDQNLYIDIIDSLGVILKSDVFPVYKGFSEGNIPLTDTLLIGSVVFRAYTNYLRNFGDDWFFYQSLTVERTKNSFEIGNEINTENNTPDVEPIVRFFPEGGILLENSPNVVGIKITDKNGKGINTNGTIIDEKNRTIAEFKTGYKGLGKFNFYPNAGKRYTVVLNAFPKVKVSFWEPEKSGIKIQVYDRDEEFLYLGVFSNSKNLFLKKYTLACMNRGEVLFYREVKPTENDYGVKIEKDKFGDGINRLVLLNDELNPVSERLYFNNNIKTNLIDIAIPETVFSNRSRIELKLTPDKKFFTDSSRVSIAVVNENSLNAYGEPQNILSQLFLDSELLGQIDSPLGFFRDEPEISSEQKLDLLMVTHGWSNYIWNKVTDMKEEQFTHPVTAGFDIQGVVTNLWNKKRVENSEVLLTVKNDSLFTFWETTDMEGRFTFKHIHLSDSAEVTLQARKSNESENTQVKLTPLRFDSPGFSPVKFNRFFRSNTIPLELYRRNYYARLAEKEFESDNDAILIEEVEVTADAPQREEEVMFSQIYSKPDVMIKTTDADFMYPDLAKFLFAKAPLFFGSKMPVSMNAGRQPVIYVDGVIYEDPNVPFPPLAISSIERVDIIDRNNPTGMALLGVRGSNGGIFIYTKRGVPDEVRETYLKGVIQQKIKGFSKYREFYSPIYTEENSNSEKPDYRTTLYWNPSVKMENGAATVSFFTSDDIARFKVLVEGITKTGNICLGETSFDVVPAE